MGRDDHRDTEQQQQVSDNGTRDGGLENVDLAVEHQQCRDHELCDVAESRVQEGALAATDGLCQDLRRAPDQTGKRDNGERREHEQDRRAQVEDLGHQCRRQGDHEKVQRTPRAKDLRVHGEPPRLIRRVDPP